MSEVHHNLKMYIKKEFSVNAQMYVFTSWVAKVKGDEIKASFFLCELLS